MSQRKQNPARRGAGDIRKLPKRHCLPRGFHLGRIRNDKNSIHGNSAFESPDGLFQKRLLPEQAQKVFERGSAAGRPEALATAARHDKDV